MPNLTSTINERRCNPLRLHVPWSGVWGVEADFDELLADGNLVGRAVISVGALTLTGTFDETLTGSFQLQSKCHVHGGAAAWDHQVKARHYNSDALVKVSKIVEDLAREVGETLAPVTLDTRIGAHFLRQAAPASRILAQALGAVPWWVDYDGITRVGPRPAAEVTGSYEILDFDARYKVATISTDDPGAIVIGSVLRQRLLRPLLVREIDLYINAGKLRMWCWGTELAA